MKDDDTAESPFRRMQFFLREIGQGPKGARDLSREEAKEAMELILADAVPSSQAGGFLLLERFKGESPDELLGFTDAVRQGAHLIQPHVEGLLDVGSPYDGRKRSLVISPAASIIASAAGVPIVMHGGQGIGPKHGVTVGEVLDLLGVDIDSGPDDVRASIEEQGFGYMAQSRFVPLVSSLRQLREEIALRSNLNTIEKLYNLAGASFSIIGLTHLPYLDKMLEATTQMGFSRLMILQGIEGNEDAPTSRPCRVFEVRRGEMSEYRLNPSDYDVEPTTTNDVAGGDASHSAEVILSVLQGKEKGARADLFTLNAGVRIYLGGKADSIEDGLGQAREALTSGAALAKLEALRQRREAHVR